MTRVFQPIPHEKFIKRAMKRKKLRLFFRRKVLEKSRKNKKGDYTSLLGLPHFYEGVQEIYVS